MHAGKPNFLHVLLGALRVGRGFSPKISSIKAAAFIQGHGMADATHFGVRARVRQMLRVVNPTDRRDGVPKSQEVDRARTAKGLLESATDIPFVGVAEDSSQIRHEIVGAGL